MNSCINVKMKGRNGREKQNNNEKKVQGSNDTKINKSDFH